MVVNIINLLSYAHDDALRYLAMSQQTFAEVDNPFALRFLTPFLVHQLTKTGLSPNDAWIQLTFTATAATLVVFLNNLAIAAAVYTALRARLAWFTIVIVIGSVNNETVMMFAPSTYYSPGHAANAYAASLPHRPNHPSPHHNHPPGLPTLDAKPPTPQPSTTHP
ncbi:hypothetical protein ACFQ1S_01390 [Kibdelosporangium lantanae]|uniref:DUF5658 domain-containing protein n=1 Tax=Kibdelosporangium lantanae TaxID=1497396 RepID=A0ABW3M0X5_9PSEU